MEYRTRINLFKLKTLLLWSWMWMPALAVFAVLKAAEFLGDLAGRAADRINESEPAWFSAARLRVKDMERRGLEEKRRRSAEAARRRAGWLEIRMLDGGVTGKHYDRA